jgi:hypothetical protein
LQIPDAHNILLAMPGAHRGSIIKIDYSEG